MIRNAFFVFVLFYLVSCVAPGTSFEELDQIQIDTSLKCIEMTNTFTPNNDGINDFWNLNFPNYDNLKLIILNKWGNKIVEYSGVNNYQWDGKTFDGGDLPSGTYYYIIELSVSGQAPIDQTGPITLIR